jgi:hypothetical protein
VTAAPRSVDREPLPRYGAVEGALARGLLRRAQTLATWRAAGHGVPPQTSAYLAPRISVR